MSGQVRSSQVRSSQVKLGQVSANLIQLARKPASSMARSSD